MAISDTFVLKLLARVVVVLLALTLTGASAIKAKEDPLDPSKPLGPTRLTITIDDLPASGGPPPGTTPKDVARSFIAALQANGVTEPYGFATGDFIEHAPQEASILKQWLALGYPLGNHTYDHVNLDDVDAPRFIESIQKQDKILASFDTSPESIHRRRMFRYPYTEEGDTLQRREAVREYLSKNGYQIAEITTDYYDWAWNAAYLRCLAAHNDASVAWLKSHAEESATRHLRSSNAISERLFQRRIPQILLIHMNAFTALTLSEILKKWRDDGVVFVPLSETLSDPVYKVDPNYPYEGGRTFLQQIADSRETWIGRFKDSTYSLRHLNRVCSDVKEGEPH